MATHSRRRCRAPLLRGHCRLGVRARCVGDAAPLFIFSSLLQRMSSILRDEEKSGDLTDACAIPTVGARCRGSWRGPQSGGGMHPPSPRGWLPGEAQARFQIYSWSKNTRTLKDLEWFGPPERNTLRSLRDVLLLCLWISLSSASKSFLRLEPFSSGRLPFYSARRTRTQALDPDMWAQQGCIVY